MVTSNLAVNFAKYGLKCMPAGPDRTLLIDL